MGVERWVYEDRTNFVIVNVNAADAISGGWLTLGVFQRIAYRCERDGHWTASITEIAEEVGLTFKQTRRALDNLREADWITSKREHPRDSTQRWSVVWEEESGGHPEMPHRASGDAPPTPRCPTGHQEVPYRASGGAPQGTTPSSETTKTSTDTLDASDDASAQRLVDHHHELVARWGDAPRTTAATRQVAQRLIEAHGYDVVASLITWAQGHEFWRTRTKTLGKVEQHLSTIREQRKGERGGRPAADHDDSEGRREVLAQLKEAGW